MIGNRMSLLPVSEFCGHAASLADETGAGPDARVSTYFHGLLAGADPATLPALTDEEREEVESWHRPGGEEMWASCPAEGSLVSSTHEAELSIGLDGTRVRPGELSLSLGHADVVFVMTAPANARIAEPHHVSVVVDFKRTDAKGPDTLQLYAYSLAHASEHRCRMSYRATFELTSGEWTWGKPLDLESREAEDIRARVVRAALNTYGPPATGAHCRDCWSRWRCTGHLLPAAIGDTSAWLSAICDGGTISEANAPDIVLRAQAMKDLAERALGLAKDWGGVIRDPATGKVYLPIQCRGRESVSAKDLRAQMGPEAERYIKRGAPYTQHRWGKEK